MLRGVFTLGEKTGAFEHDIHLQRQPGEFSRIRLGEYADGVLADEQGLVVVTYRLVELAVNTVKPGQVSVDGYIALIIDRDNGYVLPELWPLVKSPKDIPADTAVAVNCYAQHIRLPLRPIIA